MLLPELFPVLAKGWVVRGTKEIPRLFQMLTGKTIKLNNAVLKYILICDGEHSYREIGETFGVSMDEMSRFYPQFAKDGILQEQSTPARREIDVGLGAKEPWLKEVHIDITNNCNLRCRHCFWGENLTQEQTLPAEAWCGLIAQLRQCGTAKIALSGGEAMTYPALLEVIRECVRSNIMVASLFTNGTVDTETTKKIVAFLAEIKMETAFYISLDGCCAEQHDFIRGAGRFEQTMRFVRELIGYRSKTGARYQILINSLMHKKNCHDLIAWYDDLAALGVDGWRFTTGRVSGFMEKNRGEIKVSSKECFGEYLELVNYVIEKYHRGEKVLYLNVENFFKTRNLQAGKMYVFDPELSICDYKSQACSIDPHGNVQFCTGWQSVKYGNVFAEGMEQIWYSQKLQAVKQFKIKEITACRDCKYLVYCGGGCRLECKDLYSKDEGICENFELFEKYMLPIFEKNHIALALE